MLKNLYTCKSSLYFTLVLFLVVVYRVSHGRLVFFSLNVLPSENKDYYYCLCFHYFCHGSANIQVMWNLSTFNVHCQ